jgi:hypothetical protein
MVLERAATRADDTEFYASWPVASFANHCEEKVSDIGLLFRSCRGRGLVVVVHPGGPEHGVKVNCMQHARKGWMSGWVVDWDATKRVFGTGVPKGEKYGQGMQQR